MSRCPGPVELSSFKCETTQKVWSTAIYDGKYTYGSAYVYVSDFNDAIYRLEQEPSIKDINKKIDALSKEVTKDMEAISDKKHESYDKLISLYTNVIELSKMAKSPSGSLQSFRTDLAQKKNQINLLITEIKARKPDFKE
ncbi:hypothetical protein [Emticicia sp. TH156]|uniref:hypothetical protein n=1 Tax=Emticicia sp. TH156 TaxID=2067454 RepID=UPI000C77B5CA|nr:hypothetical protein [Emticicia sp. TH156]PLK44815.1 hypothetical protein C0V77_10270 [Emticicia sp. TH156]